jgi:hypothetical protein
MMPGVRPTSRKGALLRLVGALALTASACGGGSETADGSSGPPDGPSGGGTCSADIPPGQACNTLANVATPITLTCTTGTVPAGVGGPPSDGTYVLTAQTYYNVPICPPVQLSGTMEIAGDCLQLVFGSSLASGTTSVRLAAQGSGIPSTPTCSSYTPSGATVTEDAPGAKTYTATATTFTIFTRNSGTGNPNPDRVEVFTRR